MATITALPRDLARGFAYARSGYRFLAQHRALWPLAFMPALLTASALLIVPWWVLSHRAHILAAIWPTTEAGGWAGTLLGVAHGVFDLVAVLVLLALSILLAALVSMVVSAPFNDLLSERVEELATAVPAPPFRLGIALREALRAVELSLLRGAVYALLVVSGWILAWALPGVGHVVHLLLVVPVTLSYLSLDYVDYAAARRGWSVRQRITLLRDRPALMLGFGASVWLCLCIPLVNVLFMPVSVTGGTLLVLDLQRAPPRA